MLKLARIVRIIALAMLFGAGSGIVFAAITLVNAAKAQGIPATEAATVNAPIFYEFAKVAVGFAFALVVAEALEIKGDLKNLEKRSKWPMARYFASIVSAVAIFIFSYGIVPKMKELQPQIKTNASVKAEFDKLHHVSRGVFSAAIVFALASLVIPVLGPGRHME